MKKRVFTLGMIFLSVFFLSGCGGLRISGTKTPPNNLSSPGRGSDASARTVNKSLSVDKPSPFGPIDFILIKEFLDQNKAAFYGLLALMFLWTVSRNWEREKARLRMRYTAEDLGLLKVIKSNATRILENHFLKAKVLRLDDWNKHT